MKNENLIFWKAMYEFNKHHKEGIENSIAGVRVLLKASDNIKNLRLLRMIGNKKQLENTLRDMNDNLKSTNEMVNFSKSQIDSLEEFGMEGILNIDNISKS